MTHIEELKAEKETLLKKREQINEESANLKIKARYNDKRIKVIDDELAEYGNTEETEAGEASQ
jgi:hypothetical protein